MDTRHLRAAVAVARHRSFTLAARELRMAQSTVTRQVAALERELEHQLFLRGPRTVDLTDGGRAFMPKARQVLQAVDEAVEGVRSHGYDLIAEANPVREAAATGVPMA